MGPCERNADRWLDHLYGLLGEGESRELADHLARCPSCQAALAEARRDQRRMALAACWIRNVPEFQLPEEEAPQAAPLKVVAPPAVGSPAVAGPPARKPLRRSLAQRLWPVWVAAAALLLAIFYGLDAYRRGGAAHHRAVADGKRELDGVEAQFVQLRRQTEAEQQAIFKQAQSETLRLFVIGAAQAHPDAPYACRVATRDFEGRPALSDLDIRLVRADTGAILHRQAVTSRGDADVVIPAGLKLDKNMRLEVAAKHGTAQAEIREPLATATATHVLHLALNKSMYQFGEVVFFRALVLERYSLKPPSEPVLLKFALVNPQGKVKFEVEAKTGPGGIAAGEFALVAGLATGVYSIQATSADPKVHVVEAQSRGLEVIERLSDIEIRPDRNVYRPGDNIVLNIGNVRGENGQLLDKAVIAAKSDVGVGKGSAAFSTGVRGLTDKGAAELPPFPALPREINSTRIKLDIDWAGGKKTKTNPTGKIKVSRTLAVIPSRLDVDFYPEGGDLVAGIAQRVFFRVRAPNGDTAAPDGKWSLHSTKGVIFESKPNESVGVFSFTPDPRESYTLRVPAGSGVTENKKPFETLGIKTEGVVMHVANSVAAEGEAARLELKRQGPEQKLAQKLLAVATCRGQVVAQQFIEAKSAQASVALPRGVRGIVRLTLYEIRDQRLTPVAERLVYRTPAERLDLTATASNFGPGQSSQLKIESRDENGRQVPAWALAVAVDDQYRAERNERSLAGWLMLGSEFGADVAEAPLMADDSPATRAALELFLGARGWRRFVSPAGDAQLAQQKTVPSQTVPSQTVPSLFSAENLSPQQARALVIAKAERGLQTLQEQTDLEQRRLAEQRERLAGSLTAAREARSAYSRAPWEYFRLALGALAVLAFVAGCLALVLGLARLARRHAARRLLAGAMAAFAVCLALYLPVGSITQIVEVDQDDAKPLTPWQRIAIAERGNVAPPIAPTIAPLAGQVALAVIPVPAAPTPARHAADLAGALVMNVPGAVSAEPVRPTFTQHPQLQKRFQSAEKLQQPPLQTSPAFGREFALRNPGDDAQPTLLWHPQLRLEQGQAGIAFDVPKTAATYRILVYGHTGDGRFGFAERRIDVQTK